MNNAIRNFFTSAVLDSTLRVSSSAGDYVRLDKNELPFDIPDEVKSRVALALCQREWCRYPSAGGEEIEHLIGEWLEIPGERVVAAPDAAQIIVSLLSYFALNGRPITIAQPSYSLFDYYCKTYGINYRRWMLTSQLEYDLASFPEQNPGSVIFLASPNNPVGNVISVFDLEKLLSGHPQSLFIVDEVYADFAESNFLSLLNRFNNLVLLRSFSKTMSAAGIRLGYLLGNVEMCRQIRKLLLSFSLILL